MKWRDIERIVWCCCFLFGVIVVAVVVRENRRVERGLSALEGLSVSLSRQAGDLMGQIAEQRAQEIRSSTRRGRRPSSRRPVRLNSIKGEKPRLYRAALARLEDLEAFLDYDATLLMPFGGASRGSVLDEVFSCDIYKKLILDPQSTMEERSEAYLNLGYLPSAPVVLRDDLLGIWVADALRATNPEAQLRLVLAMNSTKGNEQTKQVLVRYALWSSFDRIRENALYALRLWARAGDYDAIHVVRQAMQDGASGVRDRAEEIMRELRVGRVQ